MYTLYIHYIYIIYTLHIHYIYIIYTLYIHYIFYFKIQIIISDNNNVFKNHS